MKEFKLRTDSTKIRFDSIDGEAFYKGTSVRKSSHLLLG